MSCARSDLLRAGPSLSPTEHRQPNRASRRAVRPFKPAVISSQRPVSILSAAISYSWTPSPGKRASSCAGLGVVISEPKQQPAQGSAQFDGRIWVFTRAGDCTADVCWHQKCQSRTWAWRLRLFGVTEWLTQLELTLAAFSPSRRSPKPAQKPLSYSRSLTRSPITRPRTDLLRLQAPLLVQPPCLAFPARRHPAL